MENKSEKSKDYVCPICGATYKTMQGLTDCVDKHNEECRKDECSKKEHQLEADKNELYHNVSNAKDFLCEAIRAYEQATKEYQDFSKKHDQNKAKDPNIVNLFTNLFDPWAFF